MAQTKRLAHVVEYIKELHRKAAAAEQFDPVFSADYRYEHTLRVAHYGDLIAASENLDRDVCVAACLLHDVAYFIPSEHDDWWGDHGRAGAEIARPVLLEAGFSMAETDAMCHAIAVHVDGTSDDGQPNGPIDDIVSDADNVDRFSALRIVLWCMTERDDLEKMAAMLRDRLARLATYRDKSPLATKKGRELFAKQIALQIPLFEGILRDIEITRPPQS